MSRATSLTSLNRARQAPCRRSRRCSSAQKALSAPLFNRSPTYRQGIADELDNTPKVDSDFEKGSKLVHLSADSASAIVGSAAGLILGPPGALAGAAAGPAIAEGLRWVGREIQTRMLSPNEQARIGSALVIALGRIEERVAAGEEVRDDGLFDLGTDPEGLLEGTLISAARSYEERKVRHVGAFYASFAFDQDMSAVTALHLLGLLDRMTYHQMCALAYFADSSHDEERSRIKVAADEEGDRARPILVAELAELAYQGMLGFKQEDGTIVNPMATWGSSTISGKTLTITAPTDLGQTLVRMAELDEIPVADKERIERELRGDVS